MASTSSGIGTEKSVVSFLSVMPSEPLGAGGMIAPVSGSRVKSFDARRTSEIEPSSWAYLMISAWVGVTATMTISCWPLSGVVASLGAGAAWPFAAAGAGGNWRHRTCMPSMSILTLVAFRPGTVVIWSVFGSIVTTGNLSPVTPTTMSTKSPLLMIVPTPDTWSTWTAIARRPVGTSIVPQPVVLVLKSAASSWAPVVI